MKKTLAILTASAALLLSCEGIDCTLNNVVLCHFFFYDTGTGDKTSLADTLTVTAQGTDSVLFNRGTGASAVSLPMSYGSEADTLVFHLYGDEDRYSQGFIVVWKTNSVHYESPDCPTTMFHHILETECGGVIDSVAVSRADVNYLQDENVKVYFRTSAD